MSCEMWNVSEHVIPAAHIRGFARGVNDEGSACLRLSVKEYIPKTNTNPQPGDVTLIMVHGVGSSKESYEPFFDELLKCDLRIRAVWAADAVNNAASYIINQTKLGDEPHWFDFPRDLMQMINHFQDRMPSPVVGLGQSLGNVSTIMMSVWHPRLFSGIVMIEPGLGPGFGQTPLTGAAAQYFPAVLTVKRKDTWPSREAAREHLLKTPYYGAFDPEVFERVMKYDLRNLDPEPSNVFSDTKKPRPVTLTTPKAVEASTWMRPDPPLPGVPESPDYASRSKDSMVVAGFYRPEAAEIYGSLPHVYPSTLFVWGDRSPVSVPSMRNNYLKTTGTGKGGNGGVARGRVKEAFVSGARHPAPLEKPEGTAKAVAPWLKEQMAIWKEEAERRKSEPDFGSQLHPEWLERIAKL